MSRNVAAATYGLMQIQRARETAGKIARHEVEGDLLLQAGIALGAVITPGKGRESATAGEFDAVITDPPYGSGTTQVAGADRCPVEIVSATIQARSECDALVDPELSRLSIARRELSEFRVWSYGHQIGDGSGRISKAVLLDFLQQHGIVTSKRTFDDILARGAGLYWKLRHSPDATGATVIYIYLTGWRRLAEKIVKLCLKHNPDLVETNRPGMTRVWLNLSGSLHEVSARCYNAWLSVKAESHRYILQDHSFLEIERAKLEALWNRSRKTLLQWEAMAGIVKEACYAEHHDPHADLVPAHAYLCVDENGDEFVSWRTPNRYIPQPVDQHPHGGQRRKVRKAVNAKVDEFIPAKENGGGSRRVERTGRIHFVDRQGRRGFISAYKTINRHLCKHGDITDRRHYAYLGQRHGVHVKEFSIGEHHRDVRIRRNWKAEQQPEFIQRRMQYRIGWADRCV